MKYLVSGGAGFIGANLVRRLLENGHSVMVMDNLITGRYSNIEELLKNDNFEFREEDIVREIAPVDVDGIFHLASIGSVYHYLNNPIKTMRVGSSGTERMLNLAKNNNCRIVFSSTSEVYGSPEEHPQVESYWGNVNPVGVRSVYDESKRYAEALVMAYKRKFNLSVGIARIFNTYGPFMDPEDRRVIPNFVTQAITGRPLTIYGDGTQTRSFCYVDDMVDGLMKLMDVDYSGPVNLGNPDEWTIKALAELVCEITDTPENFTYEPMPEDDPVKRKPDIKLAESILEWSPSVSLKEGLKDTVKWFQKELQL